MSEPCPLCSSREPNHSRQQCEAAMEREEVMAEFNAEREQDFGALSPSEQMIQRPELYQ